MMKLEMTLMTRKIDVAYQMLQKSEAYKQKQDFYSCMRCV